MTTSAVLPAPSRVAARPAVLAVVAAALTAVLVWFVAAVLADVDVRVAPGGAETAVGVGAVVAAATVAGLLGWALLAVLARTVRRPGAVWRTVAVVVLLLSLGGPLSSGVGTSSLVVLVALHAAVAAVLVALLPRAVRGR
jgi:hypothetical protein